MAALIPSVDVRRAAARFATQTSWLDSRHSFSFGRHYDPANTSHGLLLVHNEDRVQPGAGFDPHPHRDVEIVTWVLEGSLVHRDSTGHCGVIYPGLAQRLRAGTGILHSERNDAYVLDARWATQPVHLVQMWIGSDESGLSPGYEQRDLGDELRTGRLVPVASGLAEHGDTAGLRLSHRAAALHAARLEPAQSVSLPEAAFLHLFVPRGSVHLEGTGRLDTGDAVRFTATGGQRVTALEPAEVLVWEMHAALA